MRDERIELNASYFAQTLRRGVAQDPGFADRSVPGLTWSVRDLTRHVVGLTDFYRDLISAPAPTPWPADFDRYAAERIATIEETNVLALADSIVPRTVDLLDWLGHDRTRQVNFWIRRRPVESVLGLWLSELNVHRYDLAGALGEDGRIDPVDARRVIDSLLEFGLDFIDPRVAAAFDGTVSIKVRGGSGYGIELDDGVVTMTKQPPRRADWYLSVDPVSFLLVSMGREGLAKPSLTGKMVGWGRNPRLGLALNDLFVVP